MNDEQIIQLFFTRNEDAIRQTDDRYGAKLTRLSENIVGSREDAQECVNDTYFKAWDTIPPTKPVHFLPISQKSAATSPLTGWTGTTRQSARPRSSP